MLKISAPVIIPYLVLLINKSLREGVFPSSWKLALLNPLLKTLSPISPCDTRPIALLSEVSKILERAVFAQLYEFVESNNLMVSYQSCYKKGHGTQTALLGVLEETRRAMEDRKMTIIVLFDFTNAFDCIPHKFLLQKLRKMGLSDVPIKWLALYLFLRKQSVRDEHGRPTGFRPVASGVPQGSILGPLLFALFISDLPRVLRHAVCTRLCRKYADDTQIYHHFAITEINEAIARVQADAQAVVD